jgi:hypothetical protein
MRELVRRYSLIRRLLMRKLMKLYAGIKDNEFMLKYVKIKL